MPILLVIGKLLWQGPGFQDSISSYYYTVMRDVLVGSLCAIGVFLWSYKGYDDPDWLLPSAKVPDWLRPFAKVTDNRASNLAGASAIGVALFPTTPGTDPTTLRELTGNESYGGLHVAFAALFFISLAYMSIRLFTKHDPEKEGPTPEQQRRNPIYKACGWAILVCIALIAGVWFLPSDSPIRQAYPVLWLEWGAILAFSISWFTKGLRQADEQQA